MKTLNVICYSNQQNEKIKNLQKLLKTAGINADYDDDIADVIVSAKNRDDFFKTPHERTVPQTAEEYMQWHDKTIDFADKRNQRIKDWLENRQSFLSGRN